MMKRAFYLSGLSLAALAFALAFSGCSKSAGSSGKTEYVFSAISRGSIEKTVSSSGTLEPVSSVSVLAQMSGIAEKVNADYNDRVTKGQVLVELNTDMLRLQQEEQLAAVKKAQANYDLQAIAYNNQLKLSEKSLVSDYDVKSAKTTLDVYAAELSSAKAALKVIETEISQYAFIKSPISGIVLSRDVDAGQSVVEGSSSNSSSLFTIAENLTHMQIEATVDEIDIASIKQNQEVRFTVEALPGKTFSGKVQLIRLEPETTDNVVSYYVIISVNNADGSLLPGMTADVEFIVSSTEDALLVPNAALRYEPTSLTEEEIAEAVSTAKLALMTDDERATAEAAMREAPAGEPPADETSSGTKQTGLSSLMMGGGGGPRGGPGGPGGPGQRNKSSSSKSAGSADASGTATAAAQSDTSKTLWYLDASGKLAVMTVKTGVSDGSKTEIIVDDAQAATLEGKKIIQKEKVS